LSRGLDPDTYKIVIVEYIEDAPKSGRPKCSLVVVNLILKIVTRDNTTRQWSSQAIINEVSKTPGITKVSASTV
jgi:hypothetical protein